LLSGEVGAMTSKFKREIWIRVPLNDRARESLRIGKRDRCYSKPMHNTTSGRECSALLSWEWVEQ